MIDRWSKSLPLNALAVFDEAAKTSSFTLAAQSLGMAQPSVSRFIANLEAQIGVRLFDRRHNRVSLTAKGEQLHQATALGLGHIRSVLQELTAQSTKDVVSISCTHGFAHMWVMPRIDQLKARLVNIEISVTTGDHLNDAPVGDEQLAIRFGRGDWPETSSLLLFEEEVFAVCSPELAARHKLLDRRVRPEDLATLPLLVQDFGEFGWLGWSGWFEQLGRSLDPPTSAHVINNYAFVLQAAMEGKGIALAWHHLIEPYLANNWLVEIPGCRVKTNNGYYLVGPANHSLMDILAAWINETA